MHLNSIVPVDIRRLRELASNFGDLLLAAINRAVLGGYTADFFGVKKKVRELNGRFQVAQENLSTLFPTKQIGASGCSFPKASFQDGKLVEGRLSFFSP
jgi:hypothetical protein